MREILFRGKAKIGEMWVYGDLRQWSEKRKGIYSYKLGHTIEVIPETIGQYTGLTDINGTKIFEGDIIRYADMYDYNCYLESLDFPEEYEENAFENMWTIDEVVYGIKVGYPAFDLNKHDWEVNGLSNLNESGQYFYEVIGNIHDNPELLGGAE